VRGLPTGKVVVATGAATGGPITATAAKMLLRAVGGTGVADALISRADQPLATGVFGTLWRHAKAHRLAVYHNDDAKHGQLALIAVLDSDDPKRLMAEIGDLARFASGKDLDLSDPAGMGDDAKAVRRLVRDLDSDDYPTREAASTKLTLIGEPALPFIEKATVDKDAEVRKRARRLVEVIRDARDERRKEALAAAALKHIRPGFVLKRDAEKIDGHAIDVVSVRLDKTDAWAVPALRKYAGPDWAKVRMATVGKKVVLLVGSDVALFRRALKNVKEGLPGLEADASLAAFRKQADPARKFELHVALEAITADGFDGKKLKGAALSSLAVSLDERRFETNAWVTPLGFRALALRMGGRWLWL